MATPPGRSHTSDSGTGRNIITATNVLGQHHTTTGQMGPPYSYTALPPPAAPAPATFDTLAVGAPSMPAPRPRAPQHPLHTATAPAASVALATFTPESSTSNPSGPPVPGHHGHHGHPTSPHTSAVPEGSHPMSVDVPFCTDASDVEMPPASGPHVCSALTPHRRAHTAAA